MLFGDGVDRFACAHRRKIKLEATLTPINIQKASIDATKEIYAKFPLKEIKLVSMGDAGGAGSGGLSSLLPAIGAGWEALSAGQESVTGRA